MRSQAYNKSVLWNSPDGRLDVRVYGGLGVTKIDVLTDDLKRLGDFFVTRFLNG